MDGKFSFKNGETTVHQAPDWSIRALSSVQAAIADALKVASDPKSSAKQVKDSFDKAATLARLNSRDAPPSFRSQLIEILNLKAVMKVKGFKRKVLLAMFLLHVVLTNYSTYKSTAIEITNDVRPAVEWVLENSKEFPEDVRNQISQILSELKQD